MTLMDTRVNEHTDVESPSSKSPDLTASDAVDIAPKNNEAEHERAKNHFSVAEVTSTHAYELGYN